MKMKHKKIDDYLYLDIVIYIIKIKIGLITINFN